MASPANPGLTPPRVWCSRTETTETPATTAQPISCRRASSHCPAAKPAYWARWFRSSRRSGMKKGGWVNVVQSLSEHDYSHSNSKESHLLAVIGESRPQAGFIGSGIAGADCPALVHNFALLMKVNEACFAATAAENAALASNLGNRPAARQQRQCRPRQRHLRQVRSAGTNDLSLSTIATIPRKLC